MAAAGGSCFGCGGRFDRAALKDVGDATFCPGCFARLLAPVRDRPGHEEGTPVPGAAGGRRKGGPEPLEAETGLCFLCLSPVGADAFVRLGDFVICRPCSDELMREPVPQEEDEERAGAAVTPAAVVEMPVGSSRPMRPAGPRQTPGAGTEACAGCGRLMPGPGSYRVVEGRPYCPACAPLGGPGRPPGATPTPLPTPAVVTTGVRLCDCCVRPLVGAQFRVTSGYWICLACLDSDARLARAVARARYRRRLARLQAEGGGGQDDGQDDGGDGDGGGGGGDDGDGR